MTGKDDMVVADRIRQEIARRSGCMQDDLSAAKVALRLVADEFRIHCEALPQVRAELENRHGTLR